MGQALLKVLFSDVTNYWSRYLDIFLDVKICCLLISSRRGWFPFSYTRVISEADGSSMRQLRVHKYVFGGFYFELKIKATSLNINRLNVGFTCVFPASTGRAAAQATFWREKTWLSPPLTTACTPVWRRRVLLRCIADNSAPTAWQCQASHRWGGLKNHTQTHTKTHTLASSHTWFHKWHMSWAVKQNLAKICARLSRKVWTWLLSTCCWPEIQCRVSFALTGCLFLYKYSEFSWAKARRERSATLAYINA